jgi:DNA-binding CsgD family transcriptional regulator
MNTSQQPRFRTTDLASIWQGLIIGQLALVRVTYVGARCFAVLEERAARAVAVPPSAAVILERLLSGDSPKVIAYEEDVATSTVSQSCTVALRAMGQPIQPSKAPIFLMMAAQAARGLALPPARLEGICPRTARWVVSTDMPGVTLNDRLSHGEWEVAQLVIKCNSHSQISRARGTSVRTIANQLSATFRKLGLSGQAELRSKAIRELSSARAS